jgi:hypothetical protein
MKDQNERPDIPPEILEAITDLQHSIQKSAHTFAQRVAEMGVESPAHAVFSEIGNSCGAILYNIIRDCPQNERGDVVAELLDVLTKHAMITSVVLARTMEQPEEEATNSTSFEMPGPSTIQ